MIRPFSLSILFALAILALLSGCGREAPTGDEEAPPPPAVVMAVTGARAVTAPIRSEIRLLGTTVALRHITLRAPAAGRVLGFDLQAGNHVRRGEIVAHIINREVEAAESGLAVAESIDRSEAPALAQTVKRYVHDTGIAVAAPADAIVAQRIVSSGQIVADLDPLADLIDPRSVYVEAAVPIDDLSLIRPGMSAIVSSPIRPGAELDARIAALAPNFTPGGASSPARVDFTGPARIDQAGAPVEVRVTTAYVPDAVVIPEVALFQDAAKGTSFVFVAGADGRAHRTTVGVDIRSGNRVQVTSGLAPGQIVLTSGGYALSDGLRVNVAVSGN
jgi:membrane fusion protein, multidrug efflux system